MHIQAVWFHGEVLRRKHARRDGSLSPTRSARRNPFPLLYLSDTGTPRNTKDVDDAIGRTSSMLGLGHYVGEHESETGMSEDRYVGWKVGRFGAKCLRPDEHSEVTSIAVWQAYVAWCGTAGDVPMAEAEFAECFEELAAKWG